MTERTEDGFKERTLLIDLAAQVLGVSRRTVYYRIRAGRLQTIRTRNGSQRVLESSIDRLLKASADDPGQPVDQEAGSE